MKAQPVPQGPQPQPNTVQFHSICHPLWYVTNLTKFQFVKLVGDMWHAEIFRQAEATLSIKVPKA